MGQIQQLFSPSLIQGHGSWLLPPSVRRQTRRWRWCISQDLIGLCQCERMKSSRVDVSIYEVWSYAEYICGYKYMHNRHAMKSYSKVVKGTTIRPIPRFCMFQKKMVLQFFSIVMPPWAKKKNGVIFFMPPLSASKYWAMASSPDILHISYWQRLPKPSKRTEVIRSGSFGRRLGLNTNLPWEKQIRQISKIPCIWRQQPHSS